MSPDLPELPWPAYRRLSASKPIPGRYFDKPPAKFAPLIVQIVKQESPIHIDVIIERLAELGEVAERDRRLGRIAMGGAYHASQDRLLDEIDDYWLFPGKAVRARDHRSAEGRAGEQRYISDLEILDGVQEVIDFCPTRTVGEWTEITSRSFGFDELDPIFGRSIARQIEAAIV
jgi:hypothetical protein